MWRPDPDPDPNTNTESDADADGHSDSDADGHRHPDPGQAASAAGETGSAEDRRLRPERCDEYWAPIPRNRGPVLMCSDTTRSAEPALVLPGMATGQVRSHELSEDPQFRPAIPERKLAKDSPNSSGLASGNPCLLLVATIFEN